MQITLPVLRQIYELLSGCRKPTRGNGYFIFLTMCNDSFDRGGSSVRNNCNLAGANGPKDVSEVFLETKSFESAQNLCRSLFPTSEVYSSQRFPDGSWSATIRFDNFLYDKQGLTETAALVDAITRISDAIPFHED